MAVSFQTALVHFQAERWLEAIAVCRQLLAIDPHDLNALQMLGLALIRTGEFTEAAAVLNRALERRPNDVPLMNNLGEIYRQHSRLDESEQMLRRALSFNPQFAEAAFNLGNTLRDLGRASDAILYFQQALALRPQYAKAHLNLANVLRAEGRLPRAITHYQHYLQLQPNNVEVLLGLAGIHSELGDQELARTCVLQAAAIDPENSNVTKLLANIAFATGDIPQARFHSQRLANAQPKSLLARLRLEALNPVIPASLEEIEENRTRILNFIAEMQDQPLDLEISQLHTSGAEPPMAWAYQGLDNRPLKEAYAEIFTQLITFPEPQKRSGKPKVGVVVTHGHEGVYCECLGRLVNRLPSSDLDVSVVCNSAGANILRHLLGDTGMNYFIIPDEIDQAAQRLRSEEFDWLHYWEIGTGSLNYFLPFFKPAPIQSACWGWPVTSGQPHVDFFISSELLETDTSDQHYSEKLVRLSTLPTWYAKPPVPEENVTRESCGLPSTGRVYLCTQNLRKYHPDFDSIIGAILRSDGDGRVCVIHDSQISISQLLEARFRHNIPDVADRIVFLPRKERRQYLRVVSTADVILDTLHYGGGANSLYDAFACGTPVITLPGPMHRSRFGLAAYRKMGISGLVADSEASYVSQAIEVAKNPDLRSLYKNQILEANHVLFEDERAVTDHREFFLESIAQNRNG